MGTEAQSVPAAAELFEKANDILGYADCFFFFFNVPFLSFLALFESS